jgi:3-phenylpropionate/trans-cinnamate dioxygenase ferredoxin reductase subunit
VTPAGGRVVVVGAGHAGGTFAALLRQAGYAGEVVVFGDEPDPPYHRPPLSKEFVADPLEKWLRAPGFYAEQGVTLRLGEAVVDVDRHAGTVTTSGGESLAYDHLVLATGAAPRRLPVPGAELDGVQVLRTLPDARTLRDRVRAGGPVAVVGGGYVGLEVAAAARGHGVAATVIEREDRVLARAASPVLSGLLRDYHTARGTQVLTGQTVHGFDAGLDGRLRAVLLADEAGTQAEVPCAAAVVGVGAVPRDDLARAAGLTVGDGVVVDTGARTSDPRILAIGDVTSRPVRGLDRRMRLESIPSAVEQARQAVATITGAAPEELEVPWFWSDQFDLKIKIAGVLSGSYETAVRGDLEAGRFALFHHRDGEVVAVETANLAAAYMAGRRMLAAGRRVDPARLADAATGLHELVGV